MMRWNHELNDVVLQAIAHCADSDESQLLRVVLPTPEYPQEIENIIWFIDEHSQGESIINALADSKHPDTSLTICQLHAIAAIGYFPKIRPNTENHVKYIAYSNPDILLPYLHDPSEDIRIAFCEIFAQVPKPQALNDLLSLLNDANHRVRIAAIKAITPLKSREAAFFLLEYMRKIAKDSSPNILHNVAIALWETGNTDIILAALQDSQQEIRSQMSMNGYLTILGHPSAESVFLNSLNDSDLWVRRYAVDMLGYLGDKSIYPDILKLRNDPEKQVRRSVVKTLVELAGVDALPDIFTFIYDDSQEVRMALLYSIGSLNHPAAIPIAEALITDADMNVRYNAQSILKRLSKK